LRGPVFSIPNEILSDLTMNGIAQLSVHWFYGDTSADTLEFSIAKYENCRRRIDEAIKSKACVYYSSDYFLPSVFERFPIIGKTVAVIGSASPLYEAYVERFGGTPLTIEYRKIKSDIPELKTYTVEQAEIANLTVDCVMSISSIEHSGLGRYGEEIDPEGDIKAMALAKRMVKPGGLFFLQIPVGTDTVVWNAERIYGQYRLIRLLREWELVDHFGFSPDMLHRGGGYSAQPAGEPIFVLRNADPGLSHRRLFDDAALANFKTTDARRSRFQAEVAEIASKFVEIDINYVLPTWPSGAGGRSLRSVTGRVLRAIKRRLS